MKRLLGLFLVIVLLLMFIGRVLASEQISWGVARIRANLVWNNNTGTGIKIAIIDTGVWYLHSDLQDRVISGKSFIGGDWWDDGWNHGTMVAGIIAAIINNYGLIGVSPNVSLVVARAIPSTIESKIADALYWAADQGVQIVVMPFGASFPLPLVEQACDELYYGRRILLIAAAGSYGVPVYYPAKYDSVIAVGAVDENDNRTSLSNFGPELELVAPGLNINSTANPNAPPYQLYKIDSDTSFAAPFVAGVAALIYNSKIDPEYDYNNNSIWDNNEVRQKLQDTALDLGAQGRDDYYGYGLVNAWYANQRPPGDVNTDYHVNYIDAIIVGAAFGSEPGDPNWDSRADITINNIVNYLDSIIVGDHFGETDP
jgi:subtilisin family serine protease